MMKPCSPKGDGNGLVQPLTRWPYERRLASFVIAHGCRSWSENTVFVDRACCPHQGVRSRWLATLPAKRHPQCSRPRETHNARRDDQLPPSTRSHRPPSKVLRPWLPGRFTVPQRRTCPRPAPRRSWRLVMG